MRTWAQGTARAVVLTASFVALGAGTVFPNSAFADTNGNRSVLGGNQLDLPVSAPIDASGNAVGVAGKSAASSKGGTAVRGGGGNGGGQTSGVHSVGGGNQINAPISAPINACGNAVAIFGTADAGCKGGAAVTNSGKSGVGKTSGKGSVLGGNQVNAPISAPINACGNAVALFGSADVGCKGGSTVLNNGTGSKGGKTNGAYSVGGGNQVYAPISAPVNVCGNSAALLGDAVAGCKGGAKVHNGGGSGKLKTSGKGSVLGGNQVTAPISAPINVCGNAVGNAEAGCKGGAMVHNGGTITHNTTGKKGVGSGNQIYTPVGVPINACGNAAAVLGDAAAMCHGGSSVTTTPGDPTTSGKKGVLSGNQVFAPITAPVNVCGNAAAVLGDAAAGCVGGARANNSGVPRLKTSGAHGVGAGNQVLAPVKAPIDVCGNVAAVAGTVDPTCGGGHGSGAHRQSGEPVAAGLPVLPMLPGQAKAPSVVPAAALPAMPQLPVQGPARTVPQSVLPVPHLPAQAPAGAPQLPVGRAASAPGTGVIDALPGAVRPAAAGHLPGPQAGHLPGPQAGEVAGQVGDTVTGKAGDLQQQVGAMRPASGAQPLGGGMSGGSLYVMVVGTLLAGAAALGGVVRRLRRR
ncbi:chaplin family protein [Actinomadura scrupuli]|uniref:chaplin family protein n=1 Tax=Actinomadura scrupuli TaxID=559629 RepID=UPI003D99F27D